MFSDGSAPLYLFVEEIRVELRWITSFLFFKNAYEVKSGYSMVSIFIGALSETGLDDKGETGELFY